MDRWPHQERGINAVLDAIAQGQKRILLTSPTGGGKTLIEASLIERWLEDGLQTVLYTNRRMLVDQTGRVLRKHGLDIGVRAAGYSDQRHLPVQVSSLQTEDRRVLKGKTWELHNAQRVLIDEAHLQAGNVARQILQAHLDAGAVVVGLTATPIGLKYLYDTLLVAGTPSELRACGALVPCLHFGPDEPDLKHIGRVQLGEDLTEKQNVKAMMTPTIFARVLEWYGRLNPEQKPSILFAPGVGESLWFAERFTEAGIRAAHIDGESIWLDGKSVPSCHEERDRLLDLSKSGAVKVICNRFVLREGIDAPWLCHGIFATVFGSLQSYLQSGGRLLRASPGKSHVTLQDHGGAWHRHGSLNADREWRLDYNAAMIAGLREAGFRNGNASKGENEDGPEPVCCPRCKRILNRRQCPCGYEIPIGAKSRPVIQSDGTLLEYQGDIYRPHRVAEKPDTANLWKRMYYRARNSKSRMTFRQAEGLFAYENRYWPPQTLPLMPTNELDWYLAVADVPTERLRA